MIPTHSVLKLSLCKGAAAEERTYAEKLQPLAQLFKTKIKDFTKRCDGKETMQTHKLEIEKLKKSMCQECHGEATRRIILALAKDANADWTLWSKTVERGWLKYAAEDNVFDTTSNWQRQD